MSIELLAEEASTLPEAPILLTCIIKDDSEVKEFSRMLDSFGPHVQGLALLVTAEKHDLIDQVVAKAKTNFKWKGCLVGYASPETHPQMYAKEDGEWFFASFAEARNESFKLAAKLQRDYDFAWWSWADTDDILLSGEELLIVSRLAKKQGQDAVHFTYWYSVLQDKQGKIKDVMIDHLRERLLRPNSFKWISHLHEVAVPIDDRFQPKVGMWDFSQEDDRRCVWVHLPTEVRAKGNLKRNRQILERQFAEEKKEGKQDPRTMFYLAKIYRDYAEEKNDATYIEEAEKLLHRYLGLSGWGDERAHACEYLGDIYAQQGDHHKAIDWYHKALREKPVHHLIYLKLSRSYFELEQWEDFDWWLNLISKADPPGTRATMGNPAEIKFMAASLRYNAAVKQGKMDEAVEWYEKRAEIAGTELKGDEWYETLVEMKAMNEAARQFFLLGRYLRERDYMDNLRSLVKAVPAEMRKDSFYMQMAQDVIPPRKWPKKSIVYFAGGGFEEWSDKNLEKGMGGSESAIVYLTREWAKKGYEVVVYCDCGNDEGTREGVEYRQWQTINWQDEFNIFIAWRNEGILDMPIKAKLLMFDAHDILSQQNWNKERMDKVDKVMFKSKWHRSHVPLLPDEKAVVIHNGIV